MSTGEQLGERDHKETKQDLSRILSELEECLREVLSDVLEVEMKAAYEDLWVEVEYFTSLRLHVNEFL